MLGSIWERESAGRLPAWRRLLLLPSSCRGTAGWKQSEQWFPHLVFPIQTLQGSRVLGGGGVQASNSPGVASRASFGSPANDVAGQGSGTSLNKATPETPMAPRVLAAPRRLGINTTGPSPAWRGAPDAGRAVRPSGSSHRVERGTAQRVSWQTCGRGSGLAPSEGPAGRAGARTSSGAGGAALPTLGRSVQAHVGRFWSPLKAWAGCAAPSTRPGTLPPARLERGFWLGCGFRDQRHSLCFCLCRRPRPAAWAAQRMLSRTPSEEEAGVEHQGDARAAPWL